MKKISILGVGLAMVLIVPLKANCQMGDGDSNDTQTDRVDNNRLNNFSVSPPSTLDSPAPSSVLDCTLIDGCLGTLDLGGCVDSPENSTLTLAALAGGMFGLIELARHLKSRKKSAARN